VADIFVSFTKSDQQWAHWIAQELTSLHHEPHVYDWEIGPGEDIVGWMEKRHDQADYVLCVVSPEYLNEDKAPFSTWERRFLENSMGTGGTLTLHDGSLTANILMMGDYSKSSFTLAPDSGTGTLVKFV